MTEMTRLKEAEYKKHLAELGVNKSQANEIWGRIEKGRR